MADINKIKILPSALIQVDESISRDLVGGTKLVFVAVFPTDLPGVLPQKILRTESLFGDTSRTIAICRFIDFDYKPTKHLVMVFASDSLPSLIRYHLLDGSIDVEE
ncbi:MAG: hypothetical protein QG654_510 [Patescibacteria group bacterium]|nr:hypothetical protein [Patescibacteria group bacterium]